MQTYSTMSDHSPWNKIYFLRIQLYNIYKLIIYTLMHLELYIQIHMDPKDLVYSPRIIEVKFK